VSADLTYDGYKLVAVANIIGPGDVRARQNTAAVAALVDSIRELGDEPQNAIVARKTPKGWEIISGRDRYSALLLLKAQRTWVHVVSHATPIGLLKAEIHENLHRREVDRAALTRQLVDRAEAVVKGRGISGHVSQKPGPGRSKSVRQEARELVADAAGEDVATVKKRDQRAQKCDEGTAGNRDTRPAPPSPPIDCGGRELPAHVALNLQVPLQAFKKVERKLIEAQGLWSSEMGITKFSPVVVQQIRAAIHDVAARLRHEMPAHLCPKCHGKSFPVTGPHCGLCQENGWVTKAQFDAAPKVTPEEYAAGLDPEPVPAVSTKRRGNVLATRVHVVVDGREVSDEELAEAAAGVGRDGLDVGRP
jgi:hypothetical protein